MSDRKSDPTVLILFIIMVIAAWWIMEKGPEGLRKWARRVGLVGLVLFAGGMLGLVSPLLALSGAAAMVGSIAVRMSGDGGGDGDFDISKCPSGAYQGADGKWRCF